MAMFWTRGLPAVQSRVLAAPSPSYLDRSQVSLRRLVPRPWVSWRRRISSFSTLGSEYLLRRSHLSTLLGLAGVFFAASRCRRAACCQDRQVDHGLASPVGIAEIGSNAPSEDRCSFQEGQGVLGIACIDGHGGGQVAQIVNDALLDYVSEFVGPGKLVEANILPALEKAFAAVATQVKSSLEKREHPTTCGACCLCVVVGPRELHVANVGDCLAVLIRRDDEPLLLNDRHNADVLSEQRLLEREHPGEPDVFVCMRSRRLGDGTIERTGCYVKGRLQVTRAFGDYYLKESKYANTRGSSLPSLPYVSDLPQLRSVTKSAQDLALVVASDGLWDYLSADDASEIVKKRLKAGEGVQAVAQALLDEAFTRAALSCHLSVAELQRIPRGGTRRRLHDDITVIVAPL